MSSNASSTARGDDVVQFQFGPVAVKTLAQQKARLVLVRDTFSGNKPTYDALSGIVHLLDAIGDYAERFQQALQRRHRDDNASIDRRDAYDALVPVIAAFEATAKTFGAEDLDGNDYDIVRTVLGDVIEDLASGKHSKSDVYGTDAGKLQLPWIPNVKMAEPPEHAQGDTSRKRYLFDVQLAGEGTSVNEAWNDAVEAFTDDPGEPHAVRIDGEI